uniref:Uncharacterized protein n=1 Tax=Loa loa TaxID=7209 RepID=A0A1I7VJU6_LOALO
MEPATAQYEELSTSIANPNSNMKNNILAVADSKCEHEHQLYSSTEIGYNV